jgi:L-fuconolactonase
VVQLTDRVPHLRVIIDHLPNLQPPVDRVLRGAYEANLHELGARPQVFVKVSQVLQTAARKAVVDQLWDVFGENRLLYGSDWPNSDPFGTYAQVLSVVREYFTAKGRAASEKYFWKNSVAAYHWVKRDPTQP